MHEIYSISFYPHLGERPEKVRVLTAEFCIGTPGLNLFQSLRRVCGTQSTDSISSFPLQLTFLPQQLLWLAYSSLWKKSGKKKWNQSIDCLVYITQSYRYKCCYINVIKVTDYCGRLDALGNISEIPPFFFQGCMYEWVRIRVLGSLCCSLTIVRERPRIVSFTSWVLQFTHTLRFILWSCLHCILWETGFETFNSK